jgi:hypothetical protein
MGPCILSDGFQRWYSGYVTLFSYNPQSLGHVSDLLSLCDRGVLSDATCFGLMGWMSCTAAFAIRYPRMRVHFCSSFTTFSIPVQYS